MCGLRVEAEGRIHCIIKVIFSLYGSLCLLGAAHVSKKLVACETFTLLQNPLVLASNIQAQGVSQMHWGGWVILFFSYCGVQQCILCIQKIESRHSMHRSECYRTLFYNELHLATQDISITRVWSCQPSKELNHTSSEASVEQSTGLGLAQNSKPLLYSISGK